MHSINFIKVSKFSTKKFVISQGESVPVKLLKIQQVAAVCVTTEWEGCFVSCNSKSNALQVHQ